jgi:hypothetical protein
MNTLCGQSKGFMNVKVTLTINLTACVSIAFGKLIGIPVAKGTILCLTSDNLCYFQIIYSPQRDEASP